MGSAPSQPKSEDNSTIKCDVCQRQNKTSTAVSYCKDCEETLCQICDNVHRNSKVLKSHTFLTGDQLKQVKSKSQLQDTENTKADDDAVPGLVNDTTNSVGGRRVNTAGEVQGRIKDTKSDDNSVPGRTKDTNNDNYNAVDGAKAAKHNPDSVSGRVNDIQTSAGAVSGRVVDTNNRQSSFPGRKLDSSSDTDTVPSVLDLTVFDITHHDVGCSSVMSVVFMPSGHVVLACYVDGLKLLDKHFKQLSQLSLYSAHACKVSDTEVLVSQGDKKQIQFVEILPKLLPKNVLTIGRVCEGVFYHNREIYVTCHDNLGNGEVRVVQMDGTVVRRLGFHDGKYMFGWPCGVKVNNAGDKVFVTDCGTQSVTCMDQVGRVIYKYTDTDLKWPTGMLVDRHDNVLVTGWYSHNVHVINKEGRKNRIVLTRRDGLSYPRCISYRHDDGLLAIGMDSDDGKGALMTVKASLA